ncbi:MAG: hypothetical protein JO259_06110 [Mycobacterium sp.]|nr:hypothetical protein [Mycobacterium sp.]
MDQPTHTVTCQCCELEWPERLALAVRNAQLLICAWRCRMCHEHQGDPLKMAQDHENEVRARWGDAVDKLHAALNDADRSKAQLLAALSSRDRVLKQFDKLGRYHRATDDGCLCGERNCAQLAIIDADWITNRIGSMYQRGAS